MDFLVVRLVSLELVPFHPLLFELSHDLNFLYALPYRECQCKGSYTFAPLSPPYGAFSSAPLNAPSASPLRSSCLIFKERDWTSAVDTEGSEGAREVMSKLADDSGSRRSIFIVRQFTAIVGFELMAFWGQTTTGLSLFFAKCLTGGDSEDFAVCWT